jgi:hypothetical protein
MKDEMGRVYCTCLLPNERNEENVQHRSSSREYSSSGSGKLPASTDREFQRGALSQRTLVAFNERIE